MDPSRPTENQTEPRPLDPDPDSCEPPGAVLDRYSAEVLEAVLRILKSQRARVANSGTNGRFRPEPS